SHTQYVTIRQVMEALRGLKRERCSVCGNKVSMFTDDARRYYPYGSDEPNPENILCSKACREIAISNLESENEHRLRVDRFLREVTKRQKALERRIRQWQKTGQ